MSTNRRVRFAEDSHMSSDQATRSAPRYARTALSSSPPSCSESIESHFEERVMIETSRIEHLENARLAAQRAREAMIMAKSVQADIRNSNAKLHKIEKDTKNQCTPSSQAKPPATQLNITKEKHAGPKPQNYYKEQNIISVPMAWIADVLLQIK